MSPKTHVIADNKAIYISEPDSLTCLDKRSGKVRWSTTLTPRSSNKYSAAAVVDICDDAICLERDMYETGEVASMIDVLDRKTGKFRFKASYQFQKLHGIIAIGRFAIVCTSDPNRIDKLRLSEIDLDNGRIMDDISPTVRFGLWRRYYTIGGELFRVDAGLHGPELHNLPLYVREYDVVHAPKHLWLLGQNRVLVSTYDPDYFWGADPSLSLWSIDPLKTIWTRVLPLPHDGRAYRSVAWTRAVFEQQKELWLDVGFQLIPEPFPKAVLNPQFENPFEVFQAQGKLLGIGFAPSPDPGTVFGQIGDDGKFRPTGRLSSDYSVALYHPLGEYLLLESWKGAADFGQRKPHRLSLYAFFPGS